MLADAKALKARKSNRSWALSKGPGKKHARMLEHSMVVPAWAMNEALEDARLNAIADERSGGPFVQVSLDDL